MGTVEALDEATAMEKGSAEFNVPPTGLTAIRWVASGRASALQRELA
jgi:hypothetical protein